MLFNSSHITLICSFTHYIKYACEHDVSISEAQCLLSLCIYIYIYKNWEFSVEKSSIEQKTVYIFLGPEKRTPLCVPLFFWHAPKDVNYGLGQPRFGCILEVERRGNLTIVVIHSNKYNQSCFLLLCLLKNTIKLPYKKLASTLHHLCTLSWYNVKI